MSENVTPIRQQRLSDDSREIAASYLRETMRKLTIFEAALATSKCPVARAVSQELSLEGLRNDIDVAREILEKGDFAIDLSGAARQGPRHHDD
jgi:hypothetical protein